MTLDDLDFLPQGTPGLNIQAFDCGRKSVNDFFHNEAQEYQDELFGKTYYLVLPNSPSEIVAGFTVANASIFTKRLPNARQKKLVVRCIMRRDLLTTLPFCLLSWALT